MSTNINLESLCKTLRNKWRNYHDIEDAVSHGYLQYLKNPDKILNPSSFILMCAKNKLKDICKRVGLNTVLKAKDRGYDKYHRGGLWKDTKDYSSRITNVSVLEELILKEDRAILYKSIANLKPCRREMIEAYLDGQSFEEIATKVNKPVSHVYVYLGRIRDALKGRLNPD